MRPDLVNATPFSLFERLLWWLGAILCIVWVAPWGPLYWDSFGYVTQAVTGQVGGLFFGRPLFILLSHEIFSLAERANVSLDSVEPLLRGVWTAVSALSVVCTLVLVRSLGYNATTARWSALAMLTSPAYLHASGAVLTDGPALTAILLSTWLSLRGAQSAKQHTVSMLWFLSAGVVLGLAFGLRESSVFHALSLVGIALCLWRTESWRASMRAVGWCVLGLVLTSALILQWAHEQPGWLSTVHNWQSAMQRERAQHPYSLRDTAMYVVWLFALGPVALVAAIAQLRKWSVNRSTDRSLNALMIVVVAGVSVLELLLLGVYQDIGFSPRYLLPTLSGAIALPAGVYFASYLQRPVAKRVVAGLMILVVVIAGPALRWQQRSLRRAIDATSSRLRTAAPSSVVVTGQVCPAVQLATRLARVQARRDGMALPQWTTVCPGWDWPDDLQRVLDGHRAAGKTVIVDLRESVWVGARQREALAQAQNYVQSDHGALPANTLRVWRE